MRPIIEYRDGLRVLGHPLHTILNHFPLAFWFLVFPLELAGYIADSGTLWRLAFLANAAGIVSALPTAITGLADLVSLPRGTRVFSKGIFHMAAMLTAACIFAVELLLRGRAEAPVGTFLYVSLGLTALATLVLAFGSWLGGELVYGPDAVRNKPGESDTTVSQPRPQGL